MEATPRLVVFDLAGTSIKDTGHIPLAFASAFAKHGVTVTDAQIASVRGASKRDAVAALLATSTEPEPLATRVYATFREELDRAYSLGGIHPIDGAATIFRELRNRDIRVVLNTGLDRDIVNALLSALRWTSDVVDAVVCGDDVPSGRPAPDLIFRAMHLTGIQNADDVANVGDTVMDLRAGHNARVRWNVGVCSGAHDRATLLREPHTHIVDSIADLPF